MNASVRIRRAAPADLPALLNFQQGIVASERPMDPTLREGSIEYYDLPQLLTDPAVELVVAVGGGECIGCGFARLQPSKPYLKHEMHAYLGLMYVEQQFRARGVNQRIVEHLKRWCRGHGVRELRLDVYAGNLRAISAYKKAGFEPHMLEMRLELPAD